MAVLDIDAPIIAAFNEEDVDGLTKICNILTNNVNWHITQTLTLDTRVDPTLTTCSSNVPTSKPLSNPH